MREKRPPLTRARIKLRLAAVALDGAIAAGGIVRRGLINLASAFVAEATAEIGQHSASTSSPSDGFDRAGGPEMAFLRPPGRQRGGEAGRRPGDIAAKIGNGAALPAEVPS